MKPATATYLEILNGHVLSALGVQNVGLLGGCEDAVVLEGEEVLAAL